MGVNGMKIMPLKFPNVKKSINRKMNRNKTLLTLFLILLLNCSWGQVDFIVHFQQHHHAVESSGFKFTLLSRSDTVAVFNRLSNRESTTTQCSFLEKHDSIVGVFEYRKEDKSWESVRYAFVLDPSRLKRIEVSLHFTVEDGSEFLNDFIVENYYTTNSVSIEHDKFSVGSTPFFTLINHSDTTLWGVSTSNHFYGMLLAKTDFGWDGFSGSYCSSTVPEEALRKLDTSSSWIPFYNLEDHFVFKNPGSYKYVVPMGIERYAVNAQFDSLRIGRTRTKCRIFIELETEFSVE